MSATRAVGEAFENLRTFVLAFPEAYEEFPWGETAAKVRGKTFVFMRADAAEGLSLSVKLPQSAEAALRHSFAQRTGYNLGKSGWVTMRFGPGVSPPMELLRGWIDESYRAVAPKTLVRDLPVPEGQPTESPRKTKPKSAAPKTAKRKSE